MTVSDQILGVLVGGGVAIVSGLVVALMTERRGRGEWRRQARLTSAAKAMRALQVVNREITNLAISEIATIDGTDSEWVPYHAAAIEWNSARHEAALIAPQAELKLLAKLDREQDRLLEVAVLKPWDPSDFRRERAQLGELAGEYIRVARSTAGEGATDLPSLWSWANDMEEATRPPGASVKRTAVPTTSDQALWVAISRSNRTITVASVAVVVAAALTAWDRRRRARARQIALAERWYRSRKRRPLPHYHRRGGVGGYWKA